MKNKARKNEYISIKKFLRVYFGISDEALLNSNISHKALKYLIPDLKRLPFDYTEKNEDKIASGEIVLVNDCNGNIVPYQTPQAIDDIEEVNYDVNVKRNNNEEKAIKNITNVENLNLYQLSELCKKYKKDHRMKEYRVTYRILKQKKEREKNKSILNRGEKNEKYKRR